MRQRQGFTLIELLVVVAIIALLGGMLFSGLIGTSNQVKRSNTMALCGAIRDAILDYATDCGELPRHDGTSGQYHSGSSGAWVYELQRLGKNPPYIDGLDDEDLTIDEGSDSGVIYGEFGNAVIFRAVGDGTSYKEYRRNSTSLENAFFVWTAGEDGVEQFGGHYDSAHGWGFDASGNNWKNFQRIQDPDNWHTTNNGGDDPVVGN